MTDRLLRLIQRFAVGREELLARRWQWRLEATREHERRAFLRALSIESGGSRIILGVMPGTRNRWHWIGLPVERLISQHGMIAGGTGTGKTSWLIGVLLQLLAGKRCALVLADFKGETAELLLDLVVPFLLEHGAEESLLSRLRVLRPFDTRFVPLLNLTYREAHVPPEAQAFGVASAVEQALSEPLGGRMHHCLVRLVVVCIELGLPITTIVTWLADPRLFVAAAERSADEATREYARIGFRQENRESLRALGARLNALLFWPGARRALCAPGSVSFADALAEPGITVISTGGAPAGSERLARFFGGILFGKLVRAILSREFSPENPPVLAIAEEIPEVLGSEEARQLGRLLATARYKRAAVWLTGQTWSQLSTVDPGLVASIRANVGLQMQFRTNAADARDFAHLLPDDEGDEAARRDRMNALTSLPQRHCYLAIRDAGLKAQLVLAPRLDFDALRAAGARVSPAIRQRIHQGIVAVPVERMRSEAVAAPLPLSSVVALPGASSTYGQFPGLG